MQHPKFVAADHRQNPCIENVMSNPITGNETTDKSRTNCMLILTYLKKPPLILQATFLATHSTGTVLLAYIKK